MGGLAAGVLGGQGLGGDRLPDHQVIQGPGGRHGRISSTGPGWGGARGRPAPRSPGHSGSCGKTWED